MDSMTATEAGQPPDLRRERLEAEKAAQREHVRLEIVREVMRWAPAGGMTATEVVAAAKTVEAFVVGPSEAPSHHREELISAVLHAERTGVFRDGLVSSLAAVRAAGNVSR